FHGRTYGALSATPQEAKQAPFAPLVPGFVVAEPTVEGITSAVTENTAAVLIEPIRGESGVWPVPDEVPVPARQAGRRLGAVLMDPALPARTEALGARLRDGIARLPRVREVRGAGLMVGFDLEGGGAPDVSLRALSKQRLLVNATGPKTLRLLPPLIVTEEQI